jgi:hypothetical protein
MDVAESNSACQASAQGQSMGRCRVSRRAEEATRAGTLIRWVRRGAQWARVVPVGGQHACGAGEVERDHCVREPGGVGRVRSRGEVGDRAVLQLGDDLLDHGVVAVGPVGLQPALTTRFGEGTVRCSPSKSCGPADSASRSTGIKPADTSHTRLSISKSTLARMQESRDRVHPQLIWPMRLPGQRASGPSVPVSVVGLRIVAGLHVSSRPLTGDRVPG